MRKTTHQHRDDIDGYAALEELALDFYWSWGQNRRQEDLANARP